MGRLLASGYIERCSDCGGLSAYCPEDVNAARGIAHIGKRSSWEWQCGHCGAYLAEASAPIVARAFAYHPLPAA